MDIFRALLARLRISWRLAIYWLILVAGLTIFAEFADEVYENQGFFFDEPILTWFYGLVTPLRTRFALALSTIGGLTAMIGVSAAITLALWFVNRKQAVFFLSSMGGASIIMGLTKVILSRPRPELFPNVDYWQTASPSFPSGHATGSTALAVTLFFVVRHLVPRWQGVVAGLGIFFAVLVSASRLYLQVHYPSDIAAGIALGIAWVLGINMLYTASPRDTSKHSVILRLPNEVLAKLQDDAAARDLSNDDVVTQILTAYYKVS
jgi:undecaprenyl-diphosphatase